jgi:DNA-binding transcriptional regulator YiaG
LTKVPERVIVSPVEYINPEETMQIQNDERMTVPEIAALVGVTEQAVRYWAKRGLYLNWQRSVNNRVFALRSEVEEVS